MCHLVLNQYHITFPLVRLAYKERWLRLTKDTEHVIEYITVKQQMPDFRKQTNLKNIDKSKLTDTILFSL